MTMNPEVQQQLGQFMTQAVHYSVSVIGAAIIFAIGWAVTGMLQRGTLKAMLRIKEVDRTVAYFLARAVRYGMLLIVLVMILGQFGVQTTSILAALSGAALAIGLALQGTLQNIAAGLMLLALRPFRMGEYITAGTISGTVQEIGLFTTDIITGDGRYLCAPNSSLWNVPIVNDTRMPTRRHDYSVGIGYDADIDKAFAIIREIITKRPETLDTPAPQFFVSDLGDSAVVLAVRYWIKNPDFYPVSRSVNQEVKEAFDKAGISIPYPNITYHNGDAPSGNASAETPPFANAKPYPYTAPAAEAEKAAK